MRTSELSGRMCAIPVLSASTRNQAPTPHCCWAPWAGPGSHVASTPHHMVVRGDSAHFTSPTDTYTAPHPRRAHKLKGRSARASIPRPRWVTHSVRASTSSPRPLPRFQCLRLTHVGMVQGTVLRLRHTYGRPRAPGQRCTRDRYVCGGGLSYFKELFEGAPECCSRPRRG